MNGIAQLQASVFITVEDGVVTKITILPHSSVMRYEGDDVTELVESITWKPLEGLPTNVVWEA